MQEDRIIRTKDGKEINAVFYLNADPADKVIIIGPDVHVTQAYYRPLAKLFRHLNYDIVTFDYRGMGKSAPCQLKKCNAGLHQWAVQDADAVLRYVKNNFPKKEIIFIGHGISGEIIGLAQASQYIQKLVLVNSALSCKRFWPLKDKLRIMMLKIVVRIVNGIYGYFPGSKLGSFKDLPQKVMHEWVSWCDSPNGLFDAYPDNNYRKLQIPLLAFSFSDDWHSPARAVEELLKRFDSAFITWKHMRPAEIGMRKIGSTGFFDPRMQASLWVMLEKWINTNHYLKENSELLTVRSVS